MTPQPAEFTQVLRSASSGDAVAEEQLWALMYDELRQIAHRQLLAEVRTDALSTTALVHEAYLRLVGQVRVSSTDRAHFHALAARAMRRVLIDDARRRSAQKRGGGLRDVPFDEARYVADEQAEELLALDEALIKLERLNERLSKVVECCYFGGLTHKEAAETLNVSVRTVERDWVKAKGWLYHELYGRPGTGSGPGADADLREESPGGPSS